MQRTQWHNYWSIFSYENSAKSLYINFLKNVLVPDPEDHFNIMILSIHRPGKIRVKN